MARPSGDRDLHGSDVPGAFNSEVAASYDRLVDRNPGYHEHLRMSARRMGLPNAGAGLRLLDLGCGTGASTAALLDAAPHAQITAIDASAEMLAQARVKTWPPGVRFIHARADGLAPAGITGPFDGVFAAYLVRNLPDPEAGLRAVWGVLRPGAPLAVHEYSVHDSFRARMVWSIVCRTVIIPYGRLVTGRADIFRYLYRSVRDFDGVDEFQAKMSRAGFVDLRVQTMPGWQQGIVHTFLGRRPGDQARVADAATDSTAAELEPPDAVSPGSAPAA